MPYAIKAGETNVELRSMEFILRATADGSIITGQAGSVTIRYRKNGVEGVGAGTVVEPDPTNRPGFYHYRPATAEIATTGPVVIRPVLAGAVAADWPFHVGAESPYDAGATTTDIATAVRDVTISGAAVGSLGAGVAAVADVLARLGAFTGSGNNTVFGFLRAYFRKDLAVPSDIGGTFNPATDSAEATAARLGAWSGSGVNTILGAFRALLRKDVAAPSDIGGTFSPTTDSAEAREEQAAAIRTSTDRLTQVRLEKLDSVALTTTEMALSPAARTAVADTFLNREVFPGVPVKALLLGEVDITRTPSGPGAQSGTWTITRNGQTLASGTYTSSANGQILTWNASGA